MKLNKLLMGIRICKVRKSLFCATLPFLLSTTGAYAQMPSGQPSNTKLNGAPSSIPSQPASTTGTTINSSVIKPGVQQGIVDIGKNPNFKNGVKICAIGAGGLKAWESQIGNVLGQCTASAAVAAVGALCAGGNSALTIGGCASGLDVSCALSIFTMLSTNYAVGGQMWSAIDICLNASENIAVWLNPPPAICSTSPDPGMSCEDVGSYGACSLYSGSSSASLSQRTSWASGKCTGQIKGCKAKCIANLVQAFPVRCGMLASTCTVPTGGIKCDINKYPVQPPGQACPPGMMINHPKAPGRCVPMSCGF